MARNRIQFQKGLSEALGAEHTSPQTKAKHAAIASRAGLLVGQVTNSQANALRRVLELAARQPGRRPVPRAFKPPKAIEGE